ncbi:hypothetical protein [Helicobacter sp. T3_23-1059]
MAIYPRQKLVILRFRKKTEVSQSVASLENLKTQIGILRATPSV